MKARHLCAVAGVAIAVGAVVFMQSLVKTNDHQALAVAENLLKAVPVAAEAAVARLALDYRPDGRVMQGPPMVACLATVPGASCFVPSDNMEASSSAAPSTKHQAPSTSIGECVVTRALFAQRRLPTPPVGTELTLVGRKGAYKLKIVAVRDWDRPLRGYPNVFVSPETAETIDEEWLGWEPKTAAELAPGFTSDAGRNFDRAKALLLWAAALTALCLLVNSLFLSVEAKRKDIAVLRMLGLTRGGVMKAVLGEALALTAVGVGLGLAVSLAALAVYVKLDAVTFPMGLAVDCTHIAICALVALPVAGLAALLALKPALAVRPLEAASRRTPRKRFVGMLIAFACGYGAFVAVEVWGASLMSAFVPSPEWPDAIVSLLPAGVSSFDIEKLQGKLKGVKRIHELAPLQVNFDPLEQMPGRSGPAEGRRGKAYRNALLLGSDWLPEFRFVVGERTAATNALAAGDACVITEMMARARHLKLGDALKLDAGRGLKMSLEIVGIVACNWHMVTSRGLVRGLNRMPVNTDGPLFVSFDTVEACDARPAAMVQMTHVWLDYEPEFLKAHGAFEAGRIVEREIVEALGGAALETEDGDVRGNAVRLHSRDEIADGTLAHGVDIIGSMARVPFIFLAVVSLGLIAMLVAAAENRKRELVVLRTVGATRLQLALTLAKDALKVAAWGVAIGLGGGALCGWLFTAGTRAAMANWGIPPNFAVPWLVVARGTVGALVFALAVSVPTALVLVRRAARR